jgi:uncharacterized membrane protein
MTAGPHERRPGRNVGGVSLDLVVVRFGGEATAAERYAAARERVTSRLSGSSPPQWTKDVGFVERHHNGRLVLRGTFAGHYVDVDESDQVSQKGAGEGAATGGILGVVLGPPGMAVGFLTGALVGAHLGGEKEVEAEPQALVDALREAIPKPSSAIVMFAPAPEVDELLAALGEDATDVVRRTLSEDEVAALEASLKSAPRSG